MGRGESIWSLFPVNFLLKARRKRKRGRRTSHVISLANDVIVDQLAVKPNGPIELIKGKKNLSKNFENFVIADDAIVAKSIGLPSNETVYDEGEELSEDEEEEEEDLLQVPPPRPPSGTFLATLWDNMHSEKSSDDNSSVLQMQVKEKLNDTSASKLYERLSELTR
mmetsp:Transcript_9687/g.17042  ORF Transcript_9687/g.17042 Transcript_9687/m.17042 type:complete len:166 (+) Transcript_9687:415-912(+)